MSETVITNAELILEDETVGGSIVFDETGIRGVDPGRSHLRSAIDAEGDYVCAGLIEMHTDNIENHFMPRPGVFWPDGLGAALAHDGALAAAGITTVYDSVSAATPVGSRGYRRSLFDGILDAIKAGVASNLFRVSHYIHMRCELSGENLIEEVTPHIGHPLVRLASLMDHTPGQRQWRDLADFKRYTQKVYAGGSEAEFEAETRRYMQAGPVHVARNLPPLLAMLKEKRIPIATHDDTTEEDVRAAQSHGAAISEFPTTVAAAALAHALNIATVAGAPNIVRGGSHSGGVSALALARQGVLDGLSSDYVPSSLLQAVLKLTQESDLPLHSAMAMVTVKVARMLGLEDRGLLAPGLRADILRFRALGSTPHMRGLWVAGARVM